MIRVGLPLLAISMLGAATARAQPAQPAPDKADAQSLMRSGVKLLQAKDYLGALAVFKSAYARFPSAHILLDIGTTLKLLGRDADAANAYQRYLDSNDAEPARRAKVQALIAQIDKTDGRLALHVTPADAQVQIDDGDWLPAATVATWRVTPGTHAIHARHAGFQPTSRSAEVAAGAATPVELQLAATPAPAPRGDTVPTATGVAAHVAPESPRARFGALVIGHLDIPHGGAALVGATADITPRLSVQAAVILGPTPGGYAGASFALYSGKYRPYLSAGLPVFASHGARVSVRGAGGFELVANRHLALLVELGVEHVFNAEMGRTATVFVPAAGVTGRL